MNARVAVSAQAADSLLPSQQSVDAFSRNLLQLLAYLIAANQVLGLAQPLDLLAQRRRQPLPARIVEDLPNLDQRSKHLAIVSWLARPPLLLPSRCRRMRQLPNQNLPVQSRSLSRFVQ
jgi:hypothetical protein